MIPYDRRFKSLKQVEDLKAEWVKELARFTRLLPHYRVVRFGNHFVREASNKALRRILHIELYELSLATGLSGYNLDIRLVAKRDSHIEQMRLFVELKLFYCEPAFHAERLVKGIRHSARVGFSTSVLADDFFENVETQAVQIYERIETTKKKDKAIGNGWD